MIRRETIISAMIRGGGAACLQGPPSLSPATRTPTRNDGSSLPGAARQLTEHPLINNSIVPRSAGGAEQAALQGLANTLHKGDPGHDTADFSDGSAEDFASAPGNLRVDYVLPSKDLAILACGVFWPETADPLFALVGVDPFPGSDHRLVWVDVGL